MDMNYINQNGNSGLGEQSVFHNMATTQTDQCLHQLYSLHVGYAFQLQRILKAIVEYFQCDPHRYNHFNFELHLSVIRYQQKDTLSFNGAINIHMSKFSMTLARPSHNIVSATIIPLGMTKSSS